MLSGHLPVSIPGTSNWDSSSKSRTCWRIPPDWETPWDLPQEAGGCGLLPPSPREIKKKERENEHFA